MNAGEQVRKLLDWLFPKRPVNYYVVEAGDGVEAINKSGIPKPGEMRADRQVEKVNAEWVTGNLYVVTWRFTYTPKYRRYTMDSMQQVTEVWE